LNDEATGEPTPARVRFEGTDGTYYAPLGRLASIPTARNQYMGGNLLLDGRAFAYVDGSFEIRLPPDPVRVLISKGPEYIPVDKEVAVGPGKMALRFGLPRLCNLRPRGWFSGDGRAHALSPHAALLEGAAEGLALVNLLAEEPSPGLASKPTPPTNLLAFSGERPALEHSGCLVVVNTLNQHASLGNLGLLNCHRLIFPLRLEAEGFEDWTLADLCGQAHRKSGLVTWAHPHDCLPEGGTSEAEKGLGEALADAILEQIDVFEIAGVQDAREYSAQFEHWYDLLNSGLRLPLIAGSGKADNACALGAPRTYAQLQDGEEWSYCSWIEAVRAGRTYMTSGPLMEFHVNEFASGIEARRAPSETALRISASIWSHTLFDRFQIVANGKVVAEAPATAGTPAIANLESQWTLEGGGWLAARCLARQQAYAQETIVAHSSPVFVQPTGRPRFADPVSIARLQADLLRTRSAVEVGATRHSDRRRQALLELLQTASQRLANIGQATG
jgi:hypothetical protein